MPYEKNNKFIVQALQLLGCGGLTQRICVNIAIQTNVLSIRDMEAGQFASGMKLTNVIWMLFAMHNVCILFFIKKIKLHNVIFIF